jgi:hypothetical protein
MRTRITLPTRIAKTNAGKPGNSDCLMSDATTPARIRGKITTARRSTKLRSNMDARLSGSGAWVSWRDRGNGSASYCRAHAELLAHSSLESSTCARSCDVSLPIDSSATKDDPRLSRWIRRSARRSSQDGVRIRWQLPPRLLRLLEKCIQNIDALWHRATHGQRRDDAAVFATHHVATSVEKSLERRPPS